MNKKTKTIIIILVIAIVAYLLWRRKKSSEQEVTLTQLNNGIDLQYILDHVPFSAEEISGIKWYYNYYEKDPTSKQSLIAKANSNGISYEQQMVNSALYMMLYDKGKEKRDRYNTLRRQVLSL